MNNQTQLNTGGDPRGLPDYAALRDEVAKLSHPARPDVDWASVASLSLSLFRQNGVELQTASWYTLARTRVAGMSGLNEGLAILEALLTHQWEVMWPQQAQARTEILAAFSQRLQATLRTINLTSSDLPLVREVEQHLSALRDVLQNRGQNSARKMGELYTFMHNAAVRLDDDNPVCRDELADAMPATESLSQVLSSPLVYVAQPDPIVPEIAKTEVPPPRPWKSFSAGMLTMLMAGAAGLWGWQIVYPQERGPVPVAANVASLTELEQLSPLWRQNYGFALAGNAKPEASGMLKTQWQQYITGNALSPETLSGWRQGMEGLQELTRRLNALDERKGKYLTGSELKSMVFAITQDFERAPPVEEKLYQLSQFDKGTPLPAALLSQTDMHLNMLLNRYLLIKQQAETP